MVYRVIGCMSGSSLDGLDIVFAEFQENAGKWTYEIRAADCYPYPDEWMQRLKSATSLSALDYQLLHTDYGHYLGQQVNKFIEANQLEYQVALICSHGHTTFHVPSSRMTAQLGDGAAISTETQLPVVTDLRAIDVAFGGQGAPIVPIGEKFLLGDYDFFLNLGGIANISMKPHPNPLQRAPIGEGGLGDEVIAFDICAVNRVLNMLANDAGKEFDEGGQLAAVGKINMELLGELNDLEYYEKPYPKSLANDFGTDIVYPMIRDIEPDIPDRLRTYVEHVVVQIKKAISTLKDQKPKTKSHAHHPADRLLATGGGAFNTFLVERLKAHLGELDIEVLVPDENLVKYKEALIMAFIGVLRWRQEYNVMASVTGASRDSIGGALWIGQEA